MQSPSGRPSKSWVLSGVLSLVFGPFGWLYAGAWVEVVPAVLAYSVLVYVLPSFILMYLVGLLHLGAAVCGVLYAIGYNLDGKRLRITGKERPQLPGRAETPNRLEERGKRSARELPR